MKLEIFGLILNAIAVILNIAFDHAGLAAVNGFCIGILASLMAEEIGRGRGWFI
jgi:hypothetical protein